MGHMLIGHVTARGYTLFHETEKVRQIWESTSLCCMRRPGGVNFSLNNPGGYRRGVQTPIMIKLADLVAAINEGFIFFENAFLGIVYRCGLWRSKGLGWWDGMIPIRFLTHPDFDE